MKKRIKNKVIKKSIIIVDLESIPDSMRPDEWVHIAQSGLLVWDSIKGGHKPEIYPRSNKLAFKWLDKKE